MITWQQNCLNLVYAIREEFTPQLLHNFIANVWHGDAFLLDLRERENWTEEERLTWNCARVSQQIQLASFQRIAARYELDFPEIDELPDPGTELWYLLYGFARLVDERSRVVRSDFAATEGVPEDCPVCLESFELGQRYIEFPCHISHRMHEDCLTKLADSRPGVCCPMCRHMPYVIDPNERFLGHAFYRF